METNKWFSLFKLVAAYGIVGSFTLGVGYALYKSGAYVIVITIAGISAGVIMIGWAFNEVAKNILQILEKRND
jgi:hypothetical protein